MEGEVSSPGRRDEEEGRWRSSESRIEFCSLPNWRTWDGERPAGGLFPSLMNHNKAEEMETKDESPLHLSRLCDADVTWAERKKMTLSLGLWKCIIIHVPYEFDTNERRKWYKAPFSPRLAWRRNSEKMWNSFFSPPLINLNSYTVAVSCDEWVLREKESIQRTETLSLISLSIYFSNTIQDLDSIDFISFILWVSLTFYSCSLCWVKETEIALSPPDVNDVWCALSDVLCMRWCWVSLSFFCIPEGRWKERKLHAAWKGREHRKSERKTEIKTWQQKDHRSSLSPSVMMMISFDFLFPFQSWMNLVAILLESVA